MQGVEACTVTNSRSGLVTTTDRSPLPRRPAGHGRHFRVSTSGSMLASADALLFPGSAWGHTAPSRSPAPERWMTMTHSAQDHAQTMDPTFYRSPAEAIAAPTEQLAYVVAFDGRSCPTRWPWSTSTRAPATTAPSWAGRSCPRRRRAAPLRLERLFQRADARGPRHGRGRPAASLPAAARAPQLAHPRLRHPARSALARGCTRRSRRPSWQRAGYSRPHTLHCGPDGSSSPAWAVPTADDGPGGIALLDHDTFDVLRRLGDRPGGLSTWPTTPGGTSTRTC